MRRTFADELLIHMQENKDIYLLVGDLGYKVFDEHFSAFPDRCINTGAAEQALLDLSCGLALEKKIPFVYSITPFLIYRPFETLRTYINHEKIPVRLVGSGRDADYSHDGWSHDATDVKGFLDQLPEIKQYWPMHKNAVPKMVRSMIAKDEPSFISLKR